MMPPPLPRRFWEAILLAVWGSALCLALVLPEWTDDRADGRIRQTIRVALACYFVAVAGLLVPTIDSRFTRLVWTLGWVAYLVHVALAFHLAFGWSHEAAMDHTRERSGLGEGIYASHLFTLFWTADVVWWWSLPRSRGKRPAWIALTLHGFMAFMVFEATVVYETGPIRWAGGIGFAVLGLLVARRVRPR
jgi:hypothetical protein